MEKVILKVDPRDNDFVYKYEYSKNGIEECLKIMIKHEDDDYKKPLLYYKNDEPILNVEYKESDFINCKDYSDCGVVIAKKFISENESSIVMTIYEYDDEDFFVASDIELDKDTKDFKREFSESDLVYTLNLQANLGRDVICTEFTEVPEEDIRDLKDLFEAEDLDGVLDYQWENPSDELIDIFNLWGDDENEKISYEILDENNNEVESGELSIREIDVFDYREFGPIIGEESNWKPKYLLIHTDIMKRSGESFMVPKDFNIKNLRFQELVISSKWSEFPYDGDLLGDTITCLGGAYYHGTGLDSIDSWNAGSWGDNHFWLYELDENNNYKLYKKL